MPDTNIEPSGRDPYDPHMEPRVSRLEEQMRDMQASGVRLEGAVGDVRERVTRLEGSVAQLQTSMGTLQTTVATLQTTVTSMQSDISELRQSVTRIEATLAATLPHLATKADVAEVRAELAEKPSRTYMWGVFTALLTAYAAGLAALAILK